MGNHSIGRHQYQPQQIANLLYIYMVQKGSAKDAMINALSMSPQEIGNSKQAWRIIEPIYRSFGFEKKYLIGNDTAFHKISYQKLLSYVKTYWNRNATEQDLVNYFPEIARDLAYAKELDRNKPQGSWGSSGASRNTYDPNAAYQAKKYVIPYDDETVEDIFAEEVYEEQQEYGAYGNDSFLGIRNENSYAGGSNRLSNVRRGKDNDIFAGENFGTYQNRSTANRKYIWIIIVAIIAFIFRKKLMDLAIEAIPLLIVVLMVIAAFKVIKKGSSDSTGQRNTRRSSKKAPASKLRFEVGGILPAVIFCYIGIGGLKNGAGESLEGLIVALVLIAIGCSFVFRRD